MALPATLTALNGGATNAFGLVHGAQSPLIDTKRTCARVAASEATVLLTGETGTGKELFARFIHGHSPRAARAFVPVNCGAIPETLLESELFGYVKGAFTGAASSRKGRVAIAEGGTLFLDEIGELPLSLQVKLLRLLQERTYEPIGSSESVAANFRLIAATNRDLADEVRAGRFRSDLYYRLHVCPVRLPALRERRGDIGPLFQYFWSRRGETRPVDAAVMQCLSAYSWLGNVRELENLVERVSVCAEGEVIRMADLPPGIRTPELEDLGAPATTGAPGGQGPGVIEAQNVFGAGPERGARPAVYGGFADAFAARPQQVAADSSFPALASQGVATPEAADAGWPAELLAPTRSFRSASDSDLGEEQPAVAGTVAQVDVPPGEVEWNTSLTSLAEMATQARETHREQVGPVPAGTGNTPTPILQFPIDLPTMLRELENRYINAALAQTGSNKKEAAKLLGMGRTTLVEKLRRRASDRPALAEDESIFGAPPVATTPAPRS